MRYFICSEGGVEGARLTKNDWERLRMTGWRANKTTKRRDHETARLRDHETTRLREHGTTRLRDNGTTEKHRRSQAFSGVPRHSQSCVAVRCCAWHLGVRVVQMWCQVEVWLDGGVLGVHPHSDERAWCRRCAAITPSYHTKQVIS